MERTRRTLTGQGLAKVGEFVGGALGGPYGAVAGSTVGRHSIAALQALRATVAANPILSRAYESAARALAAAGIDEDAIVAPAIAVAVASYTFPYISHSPVVEQNTQGTKADIPEVKQFLQAFDKSLTRMSHEHIGEIKDRLGFSYSQSPYLEEQVHSAPRYPFGRQTLPAPPSGQPAVIQQVGGMANPSGPPLGVPYDFPAPPSGGSAVIQYVGGPPLGLPYNPYSIASDVLAGTHAQSAQSTLSTIRNEQELSLKDAQLAAIIGGISQKNNEQSRMEIDEFMSDAQKLRMWNAKERVYGYSQYDVRENGLLPNIGTPIIMGETGNYFM